MTALLLAGSWWWGLARAQEGPPAGAGAPGPESDEAQPEAARSLPEAIDSGEGLVIVVSAPADLVQGDQLVATVTGGEGPTASFTLRDDGAGPDLVAGDGVYAGQAADFPRGSTVIALSGTEGQALWSTPVDIGPRAPRPRVKIAFTETEPLFFLDTFEGGAMGVEGEERVGELPAGVAAGRLPAEGGPVLAPARRSDDPDAPLLAPPPSGGSSTPLAIMGRMLVALLVGVGIGVALGRRTPRALGALVAVGGARASSGASSPPGLPAVMGRKQAWSAPSQVLALRALTGLAERLRVEALVLVVPRPEHRAHIRLALPGRAGIVWSPKDQPAPREVLAMAQGLATLGPVVVLVEGVGALEEPLRGEGADAVVRELLAAQGEAGALGAQGALGVLVVVAAGELSGVDLALEEVGGGLGTAAQGSFLPG